VIDYRRSERHCPRTPESGDLNDCVGHRVYDAARMSLAVVAAIRIATAFAPADLDHDSGIHTALFPRA